MPLNVKKTYSKILIALRADFQLTVLSALAMFVIFSVTPFAIYRFLNRDFLLAGLETGIIVINTGILSYAWVTRRSDFCATLMATFITIAITFPAKVIGPTGFYWFFCAIMFNFALLSAKKALALILCTLTYILFLDDIFSSSSGKITFMVTVLATTFFAYIFSIRHEYQRNLLILAARTDPLTGAKNRRSYNEELLVALSDFKRTNKKYTIISIDVDHFKDINDTYGHNKGDKILIHIVQIIKQHARPVDRIFRVGGEEFSLLFEGIQTSDVLIAANKIRLVIENTPIIESRPVTISIGIADICEDDTIETWEKRADIALYAAKNNGRNRAIYWHEIKP